MIDNDAQPYLNHQWIQYEEGLLAIGLSEEAFEEFSKISDFQLPQEGESIEAEQAFGEAETDEGPLDLYSPINGTVVEINSMVIENPDSLCEDPSESWLIKVEPDNPEDLKSVDLNLDDN